MNRSFTIVSEEKPPVALRAIGTADLEDLRVWKNANRHAFFFKGEIAPEMQKEWFKGYLSRDGDFMFLVESEGLRAGCMGFRLIDGAADAYNIIGVPAAQGKGLLGRAMRLMCSYILKEHTKKIGCRVLKDNPAVGWYKKLGYRVAAERPDHFQLELDVPAFSPSAFEVRPGAAKA